MGMNTEIKSVSASTSTFNITSNCSNSSFLSCALMTVLVVASKASLTTAAESDGAAQAANEIIASTRAPQEPTSEVKNAILESTTPANCSRNQTKPAVPIVSNSSEDYLDCFCPLKIFKGIAGGGRPEKMNAIDLEPLLAQGLTFHHVTVEDILANMKKNELSALGRKWGTNKPKKEGKGRGATQKNSQTQNIKKGGDDKKSNPAIAKFPNDRNADYVEPPSYEEESNGDPRVKNSKAKKRDKGKLRLSNDADDKDTSNEKSSNGKPKKRDKDFLRGEKSEEVAGKPKKRDKNFLRGEKSEEEAAGKPKKRDKNFLRGEKSEEEAAGKPKKRDKNFLRGEKSEEDAPGKAKKKDVKLLRTAKKKSKTKDTSKSAEKDSKKKAKKRMNYALYRNIDLEDDTNESDLIERIGRLSAKRRNKGFRTRTLATDDDRDELPESELGNKSKQRNKNFLRTAAQKAEYSEEELDLPEKKNANSKKRDQKLLRSAKVSPENSEEEPDLPEKQNGKAKNREQKLLRNAKVSPENSEEESDLPEKQKGKAKNREQKLLRNAKVSSANPMGDEPSEEKSTGKAKKRNKQTLRANSAEESNDGRVANPKRREEGPKAMQIAKQSDDDYDARPQGRTRKRNKFVIRTSSKKDGDNQDAAEEPQGQSREKNQNKMQVKIRESDEDLIGDHKRITQTAKIRNKNLLRNAKIAQEDDYDEKTKGTAKKRNKSFHRDGKSSENEPELLQGRRVKTKGTKTRKLWSRAMGAEDSISLEDLFNMNKWIFRDASESDYNEDIRGKTGAKKLNPSSLKISQLKHQRDQATKLARKSKAWLDYFQDYEGTKSEEDAGRRGGLRPIKRKLKKRTKSRLATADHDEDDQETESEEDAGRRGGLRPIKRKLKKRTKSRLATADHDEDDQETESEEETGRNSLRPAKRRKLNKRRKFRIATSDHDEDESEDAAGRFSWSKIVKILNPRRRKKSRGLPNSADDVTSSDENDEEMKPKTRDQSMLRRVNGHVKNKRIIESDSANNSDSDEESISSESGQKKEKQKQAKKKSKKKSKKHKKGKRRGRSAFAKFSALEQQNLCICLPRLANAATTLGQTHYAKISEEPRANTLVTLEVARKEQPDLKIHFRPI